ncbi:NAD(P)-binding protein [Thozetella sp. PMI_491]|nr:NAD(P)-binding protein [Thozetella sp. PMI_491]
MANTTSDKVTANLRTEEDLPLWNLTTDQVASNLHDHILNKTIVITGVSRQGLGAEAVRVLSQHGPKLLILASRRESAIAEVIDDLNGKSSPETRLVPLELDLGNQKSIRAAAAKVLQLTPVVDVLINNAGVMMLPEFTTTVDGIESHFGINHIGHFLFTNLLMPALLAAPEGGRVLNVSSSGAAGSPTSVDDYNFDEGKTYEPFIAYARSKNANLLFSIELARRLGDRGIVSFGIDPGCKSTTRARALGGTLVPNPAMPYMSASQGVASYVLAAFDPSIKEKNGSVMLSCSFLTDLPSHSSDPETAMKLWTLSERLVGEKFAN